MVLKYAVGFLDTWVGLMVHGKRRCKVAIHDGPAWSLITGYIKLAWPHRGSAAVTPHCGLRVDYKRTGENWSLSSKSITYSTTYGPPSFQARVDDTPQGQKSYEMVLSVNRVWSGICLEAPVIGMPSAQLVKNVVNWLQFSISSLVF